MIDVELTYGRFIGEEIDELERVLRDAAPGWSAKMRIGREAVEELRAAVVAAASARGPTYHAMVAAYGAVDERVSGMAELRGASPELVVVVGIDQRPLARIGGALLFNNHITLQIRRAKIERRAAGAWALDVFRALCERTSPAWGAVYDTAEYRVKVMSDGPGVAAVGRDFARFLPGVFAGNFFGAPYVELFGRDRLLDSPAADVATLGDGVLVVRGDEPDADDRLLDHLGREHFFAKQHPPDPSRAPAWPG